MRTHATIDIETFGTNANAPIVSLGAVAFNADGIIENSELYLVIDHTDALEHGAVINPETVKWWKAQSEDARAVLSRDIERISTSNALHRLQRYLNELGEDVCVWGNGSDFDNAILNYMFNAFGMKTPWKFWNNRCFRTMKSIYPKIELERQGTYHNALDDAKYQTEYLLELKRRNGFIL